jgi:hypothetical protein
VHKKESASEISYGKIPALEYRIRDLTGLADGDVAWLLMSFCPDVNNAQVYRGVIIRFEFPSKARLALTAITIFSIPSGCFGCMARKAIDAIKQPMAVE